MSAKPIFDRLALIGVGLIGSSIARAARAEGAVRSIVATARSGATRRRESALGKRLAAQATFNDASLVTDVDLVSRCSGFR